MSRNNSTSSSSTRSRASREVLPFTPHAGKVGTMVKRPPSVNVHGERLTQSVAFKRVYDCGDLPATVFHDTQGRKISWKVSPEILDPAMYIPLFLDGLCETAKPYDVLSRLGVQDLTERFSDKLPGIVPAIVSPIRRAFNSRNTQVMCATLTALKQIANTSKEAGRALIPYFRVILPVLNIFRTSKVPCCGRNQLVLGEHILETLEALERSGGQPAFTAIKFMVPTYESCVIR